MRFLTTSMCTKLLAVLLSFILVLSESNGYADESICESTVPIDGYAMVQRSTSALKTQSQPISQEDTGLPTSLSMVQMDRSKLRKGQTTASSNVDIDLQRVIRGFATYSHLTDGKFWYVHIPVCAGRSIYAGLMDALGKTDDNSSVMNVGYGSWDEVDSQELAEYNFVWSGHNPWSKAVMLNKQLESQHEAPFRAIVTMRHPHARTESWVYHQYDAQPRDALLNRIQHSLQSESHPEGNAILNPNEMKNLQNSMVWMLGDEFEPDLRTLSVQQALDKAKEVISNASYVGFVEDLPDSFESMLTAMGLPGSTDLPHVQTRRDSPPAKSEDVLNLLKEWNTYDLELYEFARKTWQKEQT